ncbi:helix-turn-helix domain-containing protein [Arhodomonas sp. SL1]|uniref:helix-turn-helix domain-containing protein n=1 Tax=Arhodomonas sp. SL1 TaxID=3425691 RepID=UPI003F883A97
MTDRDRKWLTLQDAAARARCSTKTLYRHMNRGHLEYQRGKDGRRYVPEDALQTRHPRSGRSSPTINEPALAAIAEQLAAIVAKLDRQEAILERLIRLHRPRSLADVAEKHASPEEGE